MVRLRGISSHLDERLQNTFRIDNPERVQIQDSLRGKRIPPATIASLFQAQDFWAVMQGLDPYVQGKRRKALACRIWQARGLEEYVRAGIWDDGWLCFPRGLAAQICSVLVDEGVRPSVQDLRQAGPAIPLSLASEIELRGYQDRSAKAAVLKNGVVVAPCGAGKTVIGCAIMAAIGRPVLVLVHTKSLLDQWREAIRHQLDLEPGIVGAGEEQWAPVTVATVQTMVKLDAWPDDFGLLIGDECHRSAASTWQRAVGRISALHRVGLTATPYRTDGGGDIIRWVWGPIVDETTHAELYDGGHLIQPIVEEIRLDFCEPAFDPSAENARFLTALATDPKRQKFLVDHIVDRLETGACRSALCLCGRVAQVKDLTERLTARGARARAIHGSQPGRQQIEGLRQMRSGEIDVLVATKIADEGLDLPSVDAAFFCSPLRAMGPTVQRLGRIMRPAPGKTSATLWDFVDRNIPNCVSMYYSRRKAYKSIGAQLT
jgi:superfamily II DNA or RNA helicase